MILGIRKNQIFTRVAGHRVRRPMPMGGALALQGNLLPRFESHHTEAYHERNH